MRLEESLMVGEIIEKYYPQYKFEFAINLGCGNVEQLFQLKPWVYDNVFSRLNFFGVKVINVDAVNYPGVDLVQDLSLPNSLKFTEQLTGKKLFILANVLEHVPSNVREVLLEKIYLCMGENDALIITVPNDYPYHADPIDTMYRPFPVDLIKIISLDWKESAVVPSGSYREEFLSMGMFKKIRKFLKIFWPFQKLSKWMECHRFFYLFKPYKISIVYGMKRKSQS